MEEVIILDDNTAPSTTSVAERTRRDRPDGHTTGLNLNENELVGSNAHQHPPKGQTPYTITVNVVRGNQGFGFSVAWTKPPRVERVEPGLPADQAGLKPGDYIIFVGQYNVVKYEEDQVLDIIRDCGDVLSLEVYRRGVSKHPRGFANGYIPSRTGSDQGLANANEAHPRKKLSHITFNTENSKVDRRDLIYTLINCEQSFSHTCRYGIERYLIPLKFRSDLITQRQHDLLFSNMEQLVDLSESLVDRLMGNDGETIGEEVGMSYYALVEELAEHYSSYLEGLPEADKILALKLHDMDFRDFLLVPRVPRKKPDVTSFIHKPAEHLREVLGLLTQIYSSSPGHTDNTYLDTVLEKLKSCYRGVTSQQNIMEPSPPAPPPGHPGSAPPAGTRSPVPLRPPLVSVSDIEQRLVFTKFTQPFRLNDTKRQWVFGGEMNKFEGRRLKPYWLMLFTDLLLFTKINRDRVIFVMEDPVPLSAVCQAIFTVKKKATEFRLIVDTRVRVAGAGSGYLTSPKNQRSSNKTLTPTSGRSHKKTLVLRAPTIELKATWHNLIQRQLYVCQQQAATQLYGDSTPSIARAVSTDGLYSPNAPAAGRYSSSVGDLRRGGDDPEEEVVLEIEDEGPRHTSSSSHSKRVNKRVGKGRGRGRGGRGNEEKEEQVVTLDLEDEHGGRSALDGLDDRQDSIPNIVVTDDYEGSAPAPKICDDYDEDIVIEDLKTGSRTFLGDSRKAKGLGGRVKDRLFPNRHLPKKKKMNRTQKVEKFVDSLVVVEDEYGRVTPVFDREEDLTHDDFTQKRKDLLEHRPKNFIEGEEEIIALDFPSTSGTHISPSTADERKKGGPKKKGGDKKSRMRLEGIEEEVLDKSQILEAQIKASETILSPEGYEDYIGDALEDDYPELAGTTDVQTSYQSSAYVELQTQQVEEYQRPEPTGPLSGSESMCFMDEHSPTSNGVAESRGLKRYGSSCDVSRFGHDEDVGDYDKNDDFNGNVEKYSRTSKVGGTGSGAFVADKLAMFEKVNEEEHQKYIECQEVRKRVFRPPRKSGEYIEKFYSPQVIDSIDVRATESSRSLRYYDDEYDSYDNPRSRDRSPTPERSPTPDRTYSPAVRVASSRSHTEYISTDGPSRGIPSGYSANVYSSPYKKTPSPTHVVQDYSDFDYNTYDYVGDRQKTPSPTNEISDILRMSPAMQTSYDYGEASTSSTPGPSRAPQLVVNDSLDRQTDEVMEMLDSSYLDNVVDDLGSNSHFDEEEPSGWARGHGSRQSDLNYEDTRSPTPLAEPDPLDDVFDIEDFDSQGSTTSLGGTTGRPRKKSAPPPPPSQPTAGPSSKMGGIFGRVKRDRDKNRDKEKEKKTKEKKEKKKEEVKPAGKRFQLFGGIKKTGEPTAAEATTSSPKKDKGKRRLFGKGGKENFIGRPSQVSHRSDPQVAKMTGDSFERESINVEDETEFI